MRDFMLHFKVLYDDNLTFYRHFRVPIPTYLGQRSLSLFSSSTYISLLFVISLAWYLSTNVILIYRRHTYTLYWLKSNTHPKLYLEDYTVFTLYINPLITEVNNIQRALKRYNKLLKYAPRPSYTYLRAEYTSRFVSFLAGTSNQFMIYSYEVHY